MKWIGQHIWDFISRFRSDVYMEDLAEVEHEFSVMVGPDGKLTKSTHPGERSRIQIRNDEGATIPAGAPIYSKGEVGGSERIKVGICDSSDPAKMPCIGIVETELNTTDNKDGFATTQGVYNTNISGFTGLSEGNILYVNGGSAPHLTQTKPTNGDLIQNVGVVIKTNGTICQGLLVAAIGRTNDVPWPLYVDHTNQRVGVGTSSPAKKLTVTTSTTGDGILGITSDGNDWFRVQNDNSTAFPVGTFRLYYGTNQNVKITALSNEMKLGDSQNNMTFFTASSERMRLNSTGLGIGTTSPSEKLHVVGNALITGDLTVSGTTTTINTTNLNIEDKNITLNYSTGDSSSTADGAGITIQDAVDSSTDATILWDATNDKFDFSHGATFGGNVTITGGSDIFLADNGKTHYGASNDLEVYHDGSNNYVVAKGTGDLILEQQTDDKDIRFKCDDGSGGVTEYLLIDGSANNIKVYKDMRFADNEKAEFGTVGDLQILHDGTNSYISNSTGNLFISNNTDDGDIIFRSDDGSGGLETYFYLDGSAGGSDPATVFPDNSYVHFGGGFDLNIGHNGSNSYITNNTGDLYIRNFADDKDVIFQSDDGSGGVTEYFRLNGGLSSPYTNFPDNSTLSFGGSNDLRIYHDGTNNNINSVNGNLNIAQYTDDSDIVFYSDNGSGGLAEYFRVDGGTGVTEFSRGLRMADSQYLLIGTGSDLLLYHSGTNSFIQNGNGDLYIKQTANDKDIIFQSDDGSGGVTDYIIIDGSAGYTTVQKHMVFADSASVYLGTGADLQLVHDGSNSTIQNNVGNLTIRQDADDKDIILQCDDGSGGVTPYITLDGSQTRTNIHKNLRFDDIVRAEFGNSGDLVIIHDGTDSRIENGSSAGDLKIQNAADDKDILFRCDDGSGGITTYFQLDGSSARTVFSKEARFSDNVVLSVGSGQDLKLLHDGTDTLVDNFTGHLYFRNYADDKDIIFQSDDGSGGVETYFYLDGSAGGSNPITIFPDNSYLKFGSSSDLSLHHNGSSSISYIENSTGDLNIINYANDKDIIFQSDDGSGGNTEYFRVDGSSEKVIYSKPIEILDNNYLFFGNSQDLGMHHNGTDTTIKNNTGDFYIKQDAADKDIIFQSDDGSGGTETYFFLDGSAKQTVFEENVRFLDNIELRLGSGSDMKMFHLSNQGYIQNQTGHLNIQQYADDSDIIFSSDDGSGGTQAYMTIDGSDADVKVHTNIELERALTLQHASDPGDPASGHSVIWSDTSGNLKIKINVAGTTVTKTITTYE